MRVAFFDSSALVPLTIHEASTPACIALWQGADTIVASALAYVEVHAALAQAQRTGRATASEHDTALIAFEARWRDVTLVTPGHEILHSAARLAASHALRGYDAIHCATALAVASDDFAAASGDRDLLRAWSALGIATADTSG